MGATSAMTPNGRGLRSFQGRHGDLSFLAGAPRPAVCGSSGCWAVCEPGECARGVRPGVCLSAVGPGVCARGVRPGACLSSCSRFSGLTARSPAATIGKPNALGGWARAATVPEKRTWRNQDDPGTSLAPDSDHCCPFRAAPKSLSGRVPESRSAPGHRGLVRPTTMRRTAVVAGGLVVARPPGLGWRAPAPTRAVVEGSRRIGERWVPGPALPVPEPEFPTGPPAWP